MISEINIQNFQSHKNTTLNFVEGTNIIVGKSDCGKSAILRALKWVIYNKPGGTAFQSSWGGETSVTIHLDTGETIKRVRGKTDNYYLLNNSRFNALGGKVPDEIQKALNIADINFQEQFDSPFLLSATSGEVANHFNHIAGISQIETSTKLIKKEINSTKQELEFNRTTKKELKHELKKYQYLDKFEVDLEVLETEVSERDKLGKTLFQLTKICEAFQKLEDYKNSLTLTIDLIPKYEKVILKIKRKKERLDRIKGVQEKINTFHSLKTKAHIASSLTDLEPDYINVSNRIKTPKIPPTIVYKLKKDIKEFKDSVEKINKIKTQLIKDQKAWKDKFPDICPLCGK